MWVRLYFCLCVGCTGAIDVKIGVKAALGHLILWQVHVVVDDQSNILVFEELGHPEIM